MINKIYTLNLKKINLEWLYVPDVEYYEYENCKRYLQLIVPYKNMWTTKRKFPLVLFIPGSAWYKQEMYNNIPKRSELAKRGFVIAEVQYRESEIAAFPAQVIDLKNALRFIGTIAEHYRIDMDNVFIAGNSSGGHIALLSGLTIGYNELDTYKAEEIPVKIKGIINFFAPTEMSFFNGEKPVEALLGTDDINKVPELAKSASCSTYISEREIPPILMFHGIEDDIVDICNSRVLFDNLRSYDKDVEYYEIEDEGHGGGTFWCKEIWDIVERFMKRHTTKSKD
ncbi:MAG: alpha/beta hydrolase [Lachnospiraceae bacterium]|nr:alpha/beta hydrolase [Lachnospiraceae bacterium]